MTRCLVLDAMGVIFRAADDVAEVLIPFVASRGGCTDATEISAAYLDASLGRIDADAFWQRVGLDRGVEDAYLAMHELMPGAKAFIAAARHAGMPVWCLSNDVGRWSAALRTRFALDRALAGVVVSSDVGCRKPDAAIYHALLARCGHAPGELLFVDDRPANVEAAAALGIPALQFGAGGFAALGETVFGATVDAEHGYSVAIPVAGPSGRAVSVQTGVRRDAHVRHAETDDQHEIYFEVTTYPALRDHRDLAAEQHAFLREHSPNGEATAAVAGRVARFDGMTFDFAGMLQGKFKRRRFLFVDAGVRTYRVVFDPTSAANTSVLDSLAFAP